MGVRFECPEGHKLNVKTDLIGKRAICPECGARFLVPAESGGRVAAIEAESPSESRAGAEGLQSPVAPGDQFHLLTGATPSRSGLANRSAAAAVAPSPTAAFASNGDQSAARASGVWQDDGESVWYVRTAAGQQFGPATTEVMRGWAAEGRVAADYWVWRSGWADWRGAGEALAVLTRPAPAAQALAAQPPPVLAPSGPAVKKSPPPDAEDPDDLADATLMALSARRSALRRRQQTSRNVTVLLGIVTFALLIALVYVLGK